MKIFTSHHSKVEENEVTKKKKKKKRSEALSIYVLCNLMLYWQNQNEFTWISGQNWKIIVRKR